MLQCYTGTASTMSRSDSCYFVKKNNLLENNLRREGGNNYPTYDATSDSQRSLRYIWLRRIPGQKMYDNVGYTVRRHKIHPGPGYIWLVKTSKGRLQKKKNKKSDN